MTRNFLPDALAPGTADELVDLARRSPAAGNADGVSYLVLSGEAVQKYWDTTLSAERRASFPWPGLLHAPLLVVVWANPDAYTSRYAEPDKAHSGLGAGADAWATPYWFVDGGMASMALLVAAEERGLGALFFGVFDHEEAVRAAFGVPHQWRAVGAMAIGHPAETQRKSRSARRGLPPLEGVLHRNGW